MSEQTPDDLAVMAAEAAADVLPSVEPLAPGPAQAGSPHVTAAFAGAAIADLDGPVPGRIAVLVGSDLVAALASSPLGGLDLAAAAQPALDAAALILGARAQAARTVELDLVVGDLGGEFVTVPLIGAGIDGAVLLPMATLRAAQPGTVPPAGSAMPTGMPAAPPAPAAPAAPAPAAAAPATPPPGSGAAVGTQFVPTPREAPRMAPAQRGIEMLHGVDMEVTVELGRTRMTVRDLLALAPGTVLELDRAAGSPADLLVNGRLIARGEVVVVDEDFGLRVTEILDENALA